MDFLDIKAHPGVDLSKKSKIYLQVTNRLNKKFCIK